MSERPSRRQACIRCREHKVRCDGFDSNHESCTRCKRLDLPCIPAPMNQRQANRASTKRLQHRTQVQLAPALNQNKDTASPQTTVVDNTAASGPCPTLDLLPKDRKSVFTKNVPKPRDLDGLFLDGEVIRQLFQIYFERYARFLPIVDSSLSPDQFHDKSPLLFWSIITVAVQKSMLSRDMILEITRRTMSLAMSSVNDASVHVVESLLIILNWWLLTIKRFSEIPSVLVGSLLHLAMYIGLHNPVRSQDYARARLKISKADIAHRTTLWTHVVILYQKYWSISGVPCDTYHALGSDPLQDETAPSDSLHSQRALFGAMASNLAALDKESQLAEGGSVSLKIDALIRLGDSQLMKMKPNIVTSEDSLDTLNWLISRLAIHSHHLHQPLPQPTELTLTLHSLACSVLQEMRSLQQRMSNFASAGTTFLIQALNIAVCTLIFLNANPSFAPLVDVSESNALVSYAVSQQQDFVSIHPEKDWTARYGFLVRHLMSSPIAFRNEEGKISLELRIKTRGSMSIVYDSFWWARQGLADMVDVYKGNNPAYMVVIESARGAKGPTPGQSSSYVQGADAIEAAASSVAGGTVPRSGLELQPAVSNSAILPNIEGDILFEDVMGAELDWDALNEFFGNMSQL